MPGESMASDEALAAAAAYVLNPPMRQIRDEPGHTVAYESLYTLTMNGKLLAKAVPQLLARIDVLKEARVYPLLEAVHDMIANTRKGTITTTRKGATDKVTIVTVRHEDFRRVLETFPLGLFEDGEDEADGD